MDRERMERMAAMDMTAFEAELDALGAAARAEAPPPPPDLAARLMADAQRALRRVDEAPAPAPAVASPASALWGGLLGGLSDLAAALTRAAQRRLEAVTNLEALGGGIGLAVAAGLAMGLLSPLQMLDISREEAVAATSQQVDALTLFGDGRGAPFLEDDFGGLDG